MNQTFSIYLPLFCERLEVLQGGGLRLLKVPRSKHFDDRLFSANFQTV